jgi:hypothetical protein
MARINRGGTEKNSKVTAVKVVQHGKPTYAGIGMETTGITKKGGMQKSSAQRRLV